MADPAAFIRSLGLDDEGDGRFTRPPMADGHGFVPAGALSAQMVAAVAAAVPDGALRSIASVYLRAVRPEDAATITVTRLHIGGQLGAVTVAVHQGDRVCAHAQAVLGPPVPDLIRHAAAGPTAPTPDEAVAAFESLPGEVRAVGGVDLQARDQVLPPVFSAWAKVPGLPTGRLLPEAVVVNHANSFLVGTALLPHDGLGLADAHATITAVITGSEAVFHEPLDFDRWALFHNESTYAGNGWTYGRGAVHAEDGALLATYTQQAMVRGMPRDRAGAL